jgi:hypothetical protein
LDRLIAKLLQLHGEVDAETFLKVGNKGPVPEKKPSQEREEATRMNWPKYR